MMDQVIMKFSFQSRNGVYVFVVISIKVRMKIARVYEESPNQNTHRLRNSEPKTLETVTTSRWNIFHRVKCIFFCRATIQLNA